MFEIASQIPPRCRRILDLGCGRGESGAFFLRRQPEAIYWGLTENEQELAEAAKVLSHAACVTPEHVNFSRLGIYEADAVLLRGAFATRLSQASWQELLALLGDEGLLIVETANPSYVRSLLAGLGGAAPLAGSLDRKKAMAKVKEAGFEVLAAQGIYRREDEGLKKSAAFAAFRDALPGICREAGQEVHEADLFASAFLIKARKKPLEDNERLLVHTALGETVVTPRVRILEPGEFMSAEPGVRTVTEDRHRLSQKLAKSFPRKIFIRQRIGFTDADQGLKVMELLRQAGYLVLSELDDNPFVSVQSDSREAVTELSPMRELSYLSMHGVQVSTEALAERIRPINPYVGVMQNQLKELPEKRNYMMEKLQKLAAGEDYVTFFFGALNRTREWQEVMPVIKEAIEKYGAKLRFKVLSDKGFYEALPTQYKEFIGSDEMYDGQFVPYEMYQEALHASDISFLPLRDTEFNRTKSDLKFIESAGHGAVVLASPTVYADTVRDGRTGFIYRSPEEFRERLFLLVENPERRLETAEAAYSYVRRERLLSGHYQERLAWYRELAGRWQELDREEVRRVARWQEKYSLQKGGKP